MAIPMLQILQCITICFVAGYEARITTLHLEIYEAWNFNFGNAAVTFDTARLQSSYFHRPTDPRCAPQSYVEHVPSDEGVA